MMWATEWRLPHGKRRAIHYWKIGEVVFWDGSVEVRAIPDRLIHTGITLDKMALDWIYFGITPTADGRVGGCYHSEAQMKLLRQGVLRTDHSDYHPDVSRVAP